MSYIVNLGRIFREGLELDPDPVGFVEALDFQA